MFKSKKKQVIKLENDSNDLLFVRVSDVVTESDAIIEVPFSHDAFIIKSGGDMRFYKSGAYPAFESKEEKKQWKQGLSVEVVYMAKDTSIEFRWGTPERALYRDHVSGKVVTVGAFGQARLNISTPMQFVKKIVGVSKEYSRFDFEEKFVFDIANQFTDIFLNVVAEEKISYDMFDTRKLFIGNKIGAILSDKFEKSWGVTVEDFMINKFDISDEDMQKIEKVSDDKLKAQDDAEKNEKIKEAMAELERLSEKQWEREKYLKKLEQEDKFAYYEVLKVAGVKEGEKGKSASYCSKCGHSCESTSGFCTHCGARLGKSTIVCPDCKNVNKGDSVYCSKCGKKII